jgi:selenocysteine lyase/cysteine desulfurase
MAIRRQVADRLGNEGHYFNGHDVFKRLAPAGPDHAQIAASRGIAEYFDALDAHHHAGESSGSRPQRVRELLRSAELPQLTTLLEYLRSRSDIRLLGPTQAHGRAATVSFVPKGREPEQVARHLARQGVMVGYGNFYAVRLLEAMGVDPARGAVRLSFVHYTAPAEVAGLISALESALTG